MWFVAGCGDRLRTEDRWDSEPERDTGRTSYESGAMDSTPSDTDTLTDPDFGPTVEDVEATVLFGGSSFGRFGVGFVCVVDAAGEKMILSAKNPADREVGAWSVPWRDVSSYMTDDVADGHVSVATQNSGTDIFTCGGDSDGDGSPELVVSMSYTEVDGLPFLAGVFELPLAGEHQWWQPEFYVYVGEYEQHWGSNQLFADLDGDGVDELGVDVVDAPPGHDLPDGATFFFERRGESAMALEDAPHILVPPQGSGGLWRLVPGGDLTGDGYADLVFNDPYSENDDGSLGEVRTLAGPFAGQIEVSATTTSRITGNPGSWDTVLAKPHLVGDLDGDGAPELTLIAFREYDDEMVTGYFFVEGVVGGEASVEEVEDRLVLGGDDRPLAYDTVTLADLDGDGFADAAWGDQTDDTLGYSAGALHLVWGPLLGGGQRSSFDTTLFSSRERRHLGYAITAADLDRDGKGDLLATAPYDSDYTEEGGSVSILYGRDLAALRP